MDIGRSQIYVNGSKEKSDGYVRRDFPGGFPGDKVNAFTAKGRTPLQNEAHDFMAKLLNWRKGNKVISEGSLKHFMPENGIYVYQRKLGDKDIIVMMNGNDIPDMLTGDDVTITEEMTFPARALYILE